MTQSQTTAPWRFFPGQTDYLSRVGMKDGVLIAADTGCGKTLMTIAWSRLKLEATGPDGARRFQGRALIAAPQGTVRAEPGEADDGAEDTLSQWEDEWDRFAPHVPVHKLFTWADYLALVRRYGRLPEGVFLTYYEAFWKNGAREYLPERWDHRRLCEEQGWDPGRPDYLVHLEGADGDAGLVRNLGSDPLARVPGTTMIVGCLKPGDAWDGRLITKVVKQYAVDATDGLGRLGKGGIHCWAQPSLAARVQADHQMRCRQAGLKPEDPWSLLALDEAHVMAHLESQITQAILRCSPRFRVACTATPIPNIVSNLFPVMGWIAVPDWYRGGKRNAAWPYARDEQAKFDATFLCEQRDYTQEERKRAANPKWGGKCTKVSPVIASPARLIKLLLPSLAHISKEACNPHLVPCRVMDVRVPMGREQAALYDWLGDLGNIPGKLPRTKAALQLTWLRNVCADPRNFSLELRHRCPKAPAVTSNFNPKVQAIVELILRCLEQGEQALFISSRVGLTDEIYFRLANSLGEPWLARIDSTVLAREHAGQADRFKQGRARVCLMGLRCAKAYSFPKCPNLVIGAIEYSNGTLHQGNGRVWRVNSTGSVWAEYAAHPEVRVWCVLHAGSVEEAMFDTVATKQDAANLCLRGRRLPRGYQPVDLDQVLAQSLTRRRLEQAAAHGRNFGEHTLPEDGTTRVGNARELQRDEVACAALWPELQDRFGQLGRGLDALPDWALGL